MTNRHMFAKALSLDEAALNQALKREASDDGHSMLVAALTALGGWISAMLVMSSFGGILSLTGHYAVPGIAFLALGVILRRSYGGLFVQQMGAALILSGIPVLAFSMENLGTMAGLNFWVSFGVTILILFLERGGYLLALLVAYALVSFWGTYAWEAFEVSQAEALFGEGNFSNQGIDLWPSVFLSLCLSLAGLMLLRPWRGLTLQPSGFTALIVAMVAGGYGELESVFFGHTVHSALTWAIYGGVQYLALAGLLYWARGALLPRLSAGLLAAGLFFCFALPGAGGTAFLMMVGAYVLGWRILGIVGFIGAFWAVSRFYYALDFTLLEKSGILALVGVALLVLNRWLHGAEDEETAHDQA